MQNAKPRKNSSVKHHILALDYGRRRVGVAACSAGVPIAFGVTTLNVKSQADLLIQLQPILRERSINEVVLGLPLTLEDKPGSLSAEIISLARQLRRKGLIVHLVDEALSSRRAADILHQRGRRAAREDYDRTSAALLLQEFLDGTLPVIGDQEISLRRDKKK